MPPRFASLRELSRAVAYALVYANLTGLFGTLLMSGLVQRLAQRGYSLRFLVPVGIVAFTATSNLPSQAVMIRIGMTRREDLDFDHPALPKGHPLERHVVWEAKG